MEQLTWRETAAVEYAYLGLAAVVQTTYPQPTNSVRKNLVTGSGADPYAALDRFGRLVDLLWEQL